MSGSERSNAWAWIAMFGFCSFLGAGCGGGGGTTSATKVSAEPGQAEIRGIFAGRSSQEDVRAAWGEAARTLVREGDPHWFYPPDVKGLANWVRFDGRTKRVKEVAFNYGLAATKPLLGDFVARYGKPDIESEHSHHSAWSRVVIFKKAGVELIVQKGDDQVLVETYVDPARSPVMTYPKDNPYSM